MFRRSPIYRSAHAAALLAVALFSFAFVQSAVMQVTANDSMPGMTMMHCTGMGAMQMNDDHGAPAGKSQKACPFCAAAAHAPLCASIAPIPRSSAVAWTAYTTLRPLGPRGPPARAPNARGPPAAILTI